MTGLCTPPQPSHSTCHLKDPSLPDSTRTFSHSYCFKVLNIVSSYMYTGVRSIAPSSLDWKSHQRSDCVCAVHWRIPASGTQQCLVQAVDGERVHSKTHFKVLFPGYRCVPYCLDVPGGNSNSLHSASNHGSSTVFCGGRLRSSLGWV